MIDSKWTGTEFDRREMQTLNLQQVVRVSTLEYIRYFVLNSSANMTTA